MTIQTKTVLKSYFETNDTPSESNFVDLIDTLAELTDEGWKDYSTGSTVVGWSSYSNLEIYYREIGPIVFVQFDVIGTSNSTTTSFTVPYTHQSSINLRGFIRSQDAGVYDIGYFYLTTSSLSVLFYKDAGVGGWTSTGSKSIQGQFWYEKA